MNLLEDFPQTALSAEREQELLAKGDLESIVMHAVVPAFKYCQQGCRGRLSTGELLSLCYLALTKAVKNYKPNQQRFLSYARPYLRGALAAEWRQKDPVRNAARHETPIADGKSPQPLEEAVVQPDLENLHWAELWEKVEPFIRGLSRKEKTILESHYRFGLNFRMIGEKMGLTRSRVHQIERSAILKLRKLLPEGLSL